MSTSLSNELVKSCLLCARSRSIIGANMQLKLIEYKTDRDKAWRNLMVTAINEGLKAGILKHDEHQEINGKSVEFTVGTLGAAIATFDSLSHGEVSVEVVVGRVDKGDIHFTKFPTGAAAKAHGFMERTTGFYLQPTATFFQSKKPVQRILVGLKVEPVGFQDNGRKF